MFELDTKGYVIDLSMLKDRKSGLVLSELMAFHRKSKVPLTCTSQLLIALRIDGFAEQLSLLLRDWIGSREKDRHEARRWLESPEFAKIRMQLLENLTPPKEFPVNTELPPAQQVALLSEKNHFGIVAAGRALWGKLKKHGVKYRLKIEGGGEKFFNYLSKRRRKRLKWIARIVIGKVIGNIVDKLPGLNIISDEAVDRILVYINGG